ncbi:MAG: hypothetical protein LQ346_007522 [Caloplaca aetnensis]|nr:MAG: hypothetical protein LQ346_007522 [Caloplaca aetnensis]
MAVLSHSIGILILLLQCRPVHKSWNPDVEGTCFPDGPTFYGLAAVTIVFDVVIIPLPIPALLKLQISKAKKWVLFFVIALGGFTTACSALRVWQISIMTKTQDSTLLVLWGVIELNVGIIMTCIPTLGPLFRGFVRRSSNPYLPNRAVRLQALNPRAREPATPRPLSFSPDSSFNPPAPTHGNYASSEEETVGLRNAGAATTPHDDGEILMTSEIHATVDHIDCGTSSRRTSAPW